MTIVLLLGSGVTFLFSLQDPSPSLSISFSLSLSLALVSDSNLSVVPQLHLADWLPSDGWDRKPFSDRAGYS